MTTLPLFRRGFSILVAAGVAVLGLASPAAASQASSEVPAQAAASTVLTGAAGAAASSVTKAKKYCIVNELTGSRIARKLCKTAEEWKAQGEDVTRS